MATMGKGNAHKRMVVSDCVLVLATIVLLALEKSRFVLVRKLLKVLDAVGFNEEESLGGSSGIAGQRESKVVAQMSSTDPPKVGKGVLGGVVHPANETACCEFLVDRLLRTGLTSLLGVAATVSLNVGFLAS